MSHLNPYLTNWCEPAIVSPNHALLAWFRLRPSVRFHRNGLWSRLAAWATWFTGHINLHCLSSLVSLSGSETSLPRRPSRLLSQMKAQTRTDAHNSLLDNFVKGGC